MTLQWLWERYIGERPAGYQYSQFLVALQFVAILGACELTYNATSEGSLRKPTENPFYSLEARDVLPSRMYLWHRS